MNLNLFSQKLFSIRNNEEFEALALDVFHYQSANNKVYSEFIRSLGVNADSIFETTKIPFLPVEFFKTHKIITGEDTNERVFTSSSTTGEIPGKHFIKDLTLYENVFQKIFSDFYGPPSEFTILALLPSYLEREGASLIFMMDKLIEMSGKEDSGFYLNDFEKLNEKLLRLKSKNQKTILFGVTFALLDFAAAFQIDFPELIVMETGGMKGRRNEMVREEVHALVSKSFGVENIHSEYGMTELLSQAYSKGKGIFTSPHWMNIQIRDPYDPLSEAGLDVTGGINIIDLANVNSCSFLSTQDLGKLHADGTFEILGRFDFSDVRGCNLMVE